MAPQRTPSPADAWEQWKAAIRGSRGFRRVDRALAGAVLLLVPALLVAWLVAALLGFTPLG